MYIRFIARPRGRAAGHRRQHRLIHEIGIFTAAYALQREGALTPPDHATLDEQLAWFERTLRLPQTVCVPRPRWGSKPAAFWFTPSATEAVARARALAALLDAHGHDIHVLRTAQPGLVLYRDEHQVLAVPFRDVHVAARSA